MFHYDTITVITGKNSSNILSKVRKAEKKMEKYDLDPIRILAIAPYEAMTTALKRSAESFPGLVLDVFAGDLQAGVDIVQDLDLSRYDAIISRGGTADLIRKAADLPVVEIPVQVYDVLRTMKLAENYTDRIAVVGFPGVTKSAHILCNLLRMEIPIETVYHSEEVPGVLEKLRAMQIDTVICDVVSHRTARNAGFQALLITSGESSLHQAIENAEQQGKLFRRASNEVAFLRSMLRQNLQQCTVMNTDRDIVYTFGEKLSEESAAAMRRHISAIPENRELLYYFQEGSVLHTVTASRFYLRNQLLYIFRDQPAQISLRSAQPGIRFYDAAECEMLFSGSFFTLRGSMGEMEQRLTALSDSLHPLMIIGEEGTGREQVARALYLQSELKNHPFVVVDGAQLNDRSWNYLMEHHASPLAGMKTMIFFLHIEELSVQRQHTLLSLIEETGLAGRLRLIFACEAQEGRLTHAFSRELISRLGPLTLQLPTLRDRRDEIPALASVYLSNLNMELGKQISGIEPAAMEMMTRYDWPGNYAQFKRVLHELSVMTDGHYISGIDTAEKLANERNMFRQQPETAGGFRPTGLTLDQMTRSIIEHTLTENGGNQSLTARKLGISRSTLWRILNSHDNSGKEE